MTKFRKKPVVIDAIRWDGKNVLEVYSFMCGAPTVEGHVAEDKWHDFTLSHEDKPWIISTLEAKYHEVAVGDWVIKGVHGEHYSCKPEIFEATYESVVLPKYTPLEYSTDQWWFSELTSFWGNSDHLVTLDTRRAAKVACDYFALSKATY